MSTPTTVLAPAKLAHVVIRSAKFDAMIEFYKKALGAHVVMQNEYISFMTYDDEHHRIGIIRAENDVQNEFSNAALDHVSFNYNNLSDLLTSYKQRKALGVVPYWTVNHGVTISFYHKDPDGNKIETFVDCFPTMAESGAYVGTPEFIENPIGVDVDPEDMIRRLEAGEPDTELLKRPNIGPRDISSVPR